MSHPPHCNSYKWASNVACALPWELIGQQLHAAIKRNLDLQGLLLLDILQPDMDNMYAVVGVASVHVSAASEHAAATCCTLSNHVDFEAHTLGYDNDAAAAKHCSSFGLALCDNVKLDTGNSHCQNRKSCFSNKATLQRFLHRSCPGQTSVLVQHSSVQLWDNASPRERVEAPVL